MIIRFYGRLGEQAGRETTIDLPSGIDTVAALRRFLADRHPEIAADLLGPSLRACIGDRIVPEGHEVAAGDQIEFFPPLSGG
jgi:sulfur-carrier protein